MTSRYDAIIVGNGVAGYACARALARRGRRPLLVGPGLPFDRPPLSKHALAAGAATPYADAAGLSDAGITTLDGAAVDGDLSRARVTVLSDGVKIELSASALVLAVGLSYEPVPIPGLDAAHGNATVEDFERLVATLARGAGGRRIAIVGGGLIGVETAVTLAAAGHQVVVADIEPRPLHRLHDPLPEVAAETLQSSGVRFCGELAITAVHTRADGSATLETAGETIEADVVIAATGGRQRRADWLGPLPHAVDDDMRVPGYDGVFAIGDCSAPPHLQYGRLRLPHWDIAIGTAERAAAAIDGETGQYDRLPYWWSDLGTTRIAELGSAAHAVQWSDDGALYVGRDASDTVVCCTVIGNPRRLRDARALLLAAA